MEQKIINITSGKGPIECQWVIVKTLQVLLKEANLNEIKTKILKQSVGERNNLLESVSIKTEGDNLIDFLDNWIGTIKWIGESPYRKNHKRKNWFIEIQPYEVSSNSEFKNKDVIFQTTRSSGAGGQHVNKTESAVRAIHTKTGLSVFVQDSRSQHQNKRIALLRLEYLYNKRIVTKSDKRQTEEWVGNLNIERGNPKRIYKGSNFKLTKIN